MKAVPNAPSTVLDSHQSSYLIHECEEKLEPQNLSMSECAVLLSYNSRQHRKKKAEKQDTEESGEADPIKSRRQKKHGHSPTRKYQHTRVPVETDDTSE